VNEKLISGYAAYITADEYGASAAGDAPATTPLIPWAISAGLVYYSAAGGAGFIYSLSHNC
jgi:hypothetical protein